MTTDRIFLVGILWALVLLGLLVVREVLRVSTRPGARALLPGLNILVVVMVLAFSLAALLRLAELVREPGEPGSTPSGQVAASSPSPGPIAPPSLNSLPSLSPDSVGASSVR